MGHNCLLLLCQLHIVLTCDILPGHRALYPPIVPRVQTELVCYHGIGTWLLISWRLKKPKQPNPQALFVQRCLNLLSACLHSSLLPCNEENRSADGEI